MADLNDINNTRDITEEMDPNDIQQNKVMAILAYLSWLVLIPLLAAKESKFARFHCNQGLILAIAEIACWIIFGILGIIPYIGIIFRIIGWLADIAFFVLAVLGIINAYNGKAKELPIIGKFQILK